MKILLLHGPNLNLLGSREPEIYGRETLAEINQRVVSLGNTLGCEIVCYQSNHEGALIDELQRANQDRDGVIFNPGAYTHTSVALRDAISSISIPVVEVHLSNIQAREEFRRHSLIAPVCLGTITGFGWNSYLLGLHALIAYLKNETR